MNRFWLWTSTESLLTESWSFPYSCRFAEISLLFVIVLSKPKIQHCVEPWRDRRHCRRLAREESVSSPEASSSTGSLCTALHRHGEIFDMTSAMKREPPPKVRGQPEFTIPWIVEFGCNRYKNSYWANDTPTKYTVYWRSSQLLVITSFVVRRALSPRQDVYSFRMWEPEVGGSVVEFGETNHPGQSNYCEFGEGICCLTNFFLLRFFSRFLRQILEFKRSTTLP